ncbi:unnamed protein product, partial [Prorocentrum cordatum]
GSCGLAELPLRLLLLLLVLLLLLLPASQLLTATQAVCVHLQPFDPIVVAVSWDNFALTPSFQRDIPPAHHAHHKDPQKVRPIWSKYEAGRDVVALAARGGGEYDVSDADIQAFYDETISGNGGDPPKGTIAAELIVKHFHGGHRRRQMKLGKNVVKGGPGSDETQKVMDDGKGWVWLAADMSPGGLAVQLYTSVPYGKRPLLVAKRSEVDTMFEKVNWDLMDKRIDTTMGGPQLYAFVPYGKRPLLVAKRSEVDTMFEKVNWDLMDKRIDTTMGGPQVNQRDSGLGLRISRSRSAPFARPRAAMAPLRGTALPACLAIALGFYLLPSAFAAPAPTARPAASVATARGQVALAARGGGEYDVSDADIQAFYDETISGNGGDPPKGTIAAELIAKHFHGEQMKLGKNVVKGGPGSDETQKVMDDGKGWVWLAADMSPGGLAVQLCTSVPYGKRPLLVAKRSEVDTMFEKANWDLMDKRIDTTMGGPQ